MMSNKIPAIAMCTLCILFACSVRRDTPTAVSTVSDDAKDGVMGGRSIRIFNVVGQSDGHLADCACIQNTSAQIEFFLSAVIYVNDDEIMKDGKYEYQTVGLPFLAELGRIIYAYEQTR